ncbi:hypothetical protein [Microbacterium sp. KR10-403]|uniref:hypothetical protein n=1 Tax=Microbacterium sp. KR10-403 TaxID=3158581 RepID=UPI0032E50B23
MTDYLVLYRLARGAPAPAPDPAELERGKAAWGAWLGSIGAALIDPGAPTRPIGPEVSGVVDRVSGFTLLRAASDDELLGMLASHPHREVGTFEVHAVDVPPIARPS